MKLKRPRRLPCPEAARCEKCIEPRRRALSQYDPEDKIRLIKRVWAWCDCRGTYRVAIPLTEFFDKRE